MATTTLRATNWRTAAIQQTLLASTFYDSAYNALLREIRHACPNHVTLTLWSDPERAQLLPFLATQADRSRASSPTAPPTTPSASAGVVASCSSARPAPARR